MAEQITITLDADGAKQLLGLATQLMDGLENHVVDGKTTWHGTVGKVLLEISDSDIQAAANAGSVIQQALGQTADAGETPALPGKADLVQAYDKLVRSTIALLYEGRTVPAIRSMEIALETMPGVRPYSGKDKLAERAKAEG